MIGCIIMASGLSVRYGKNKLLEKLGDREVILHTAGNLIAAGFAPLTVTRSVEVKALMEKEGLACALHDGPKRSDTMHVGLQNLDPDLSGYLFMPGDQPLVRPDSLRRMTAVFSDHPERAIRLITIRREVPYCSRLFAGRSCWPMRESAAASKC